MADTAKRVDPEEERKLLEYIQSEVMRGQDAKSIRIKLLQAGWAEPDVLRLIELAIAKPDLKAPEKVKVLDFEQALVFQRDGNLKLQRDIIDGRRRKKIEESEAIRMPKPPPEMPKKKAMTPEEWARMIRIASRVSLIGLLAYHAVLLGQKYLG
jgi:hypothetical protein